MGKAAKRKQLRREGGLSNLTKSRLSQGRGFARKQVSNLSLFGMGDLAKGCYEKHGRGILFNIPGAAPKYVLPCCSWLKPKEIEEISNYDPEREVILAELIDYSASSRVMNRLSISKANQLKVKSNLAIVDDLVSQIWVASSANEPKK